MITVFFGRGNTAAGYIKVTATRSCSICPGSDRITTGRLAVLSLMIAISVIPAFAQERGIGLVPARHPEYSDFYKNSYALVIGIDNYVSIPKLRYATNDARSFAGLLESEYGFVPLNVIVLLDSSATRKNIMLAFDRLRRNAKKNDRVLVFFAGHGETIEMPDGRQKGYILPYDVDTQDLITTAISTDGLNEISQLMPAKHLFFVMDACYGGLIFSRAAPLSPSVADYLSVISQREARKALTAGGRDQTVRDNGPGGHSVFTYYLITGLQSGAADLNGDGMITSSELDSYIAPRVTAETNRAQTPEYGILGGDTGGDFVFIPNSVPLANMVQTTIGSNPIGASVSVDGKSAGVTPLTVQLSPDKHFVSVSKMGYAASSDTVLVAQNGFNEFNYSLNEITIPITLTCNVDSASVYLDTREVARVVGGKAKIMVPVGSHTVELRKNRYASASSTVDFEQGGNYDLPFILDRALTSMNVIVEPDSAAVYIDGSLRLLGTGTVDVKIGTHQMTVMREGYETYEDKIAAAGNEASVDVALVPITERLALSTNPSGAVISIDDMPNSLSPASLQLGYGRHEIKIEKRGYKPVVLDEVVDKTETTTKKVNLVLSTQGIADEIIRTRLSSVNSLRWSTITLTALSGVAAIVLASRTSTAYSRYLVATTPYDISGTWDRYRFSLVNRNIAIGSTVLFGLASLYSIFKDVNPDEAYRLANQIDSKGATFSDYPSVDSYLEGPDPVIMDFAGGYGMTPMPGGKAILNLIPVGVTLNLPLGQALYLRIGGGYSRLMPAAGQPQTDVSSDDPMLSDLNLLDLKCGLGATIGKIRLAGDYIYMFSASQSGVNPLLPSSLFEFSLEGEALPGLYVGAGITFFESKRLLGVQYDNALGTPTYDVTSGGLLFYPSLVVGFNL